MSYKVGLRRIFFEDTNRSNWDKTGKRPLLAHVWYPTENTSNETDIFIGPPDTPFAIACRAIPNADLLVATEKFPLILLSHGTGGMSLHLGWMASLLASQGYIVAGVNHHGNNALEPYVSKGFLHYWERPRDVTAFLDHLLADPNWGGQIDINRIGAAGFSLGGFTVLSLAGGITNIQHFLDALINSGLDLKELVPPEFDDKAAFIDELRTLAIHEAAANRSYRDERIKAVFSIAPVLGEGFLPVGLHTISIPVQIVVGSEDFLAPAATNASFFADHIRNSTLTILPDVGHYTFLAAATEIGRQSLPLFCVDPKGVDRAVIHQQVAEMAFAFFNKNLRS